MSIPTLVTSFVLGAMGCVVMALVSNAGIERQHRRIEALHERRGTPAQQDKSLV